MHPGHVAFRSGNDGIREFHAATKTFRFDDVLVSGIAVAKMDPDLDSVRNEIDMPAYAADSSLEDVRIVKVVASVIADDLHHRIPLQGQFLMGIAEAIASVSAFSARSIAGSTAARSASVTKLLTSANAVGMLT